MAAKSDSVWAVDIGNNSLKALRLYAEGDTVQVIGFDCIQHDKILTGSNVTATERDELIALSLRRFVEQNDLGKDNMAVSVPSQNSFARFVTLPPVDSKRIPEIVKFEAAQQIPFDINDVQWDWQLMSDAGESEKKVGIFAIKNEVVDSTLEHFSRQDMAVGYVQMAPMALYNYVLYDRADLAGAGNQAIVVLDIGAENTDLVVCTGSTVWQRCIPMGGNAFTRAIADAFKLNFQRAEKLKRTAPMSKYARQTFQAMRPVFTDLASEIQRSLGFYSSSNPNTKLLKVVAFGGGTKMRGLLKYLRQTLQMPVERPDSFKKLAMGSGVSAAKFHANVSDFGVVYGLALQGLELARLESNLLPQSVARSMVWASKTKYFTAAACMLLLVSLMCLARMTLDKVGWDKNGGYRAGTEKVANDAERAGQDLREIESEARKYETVAKGAFKLFDHRDVVPVLHQTILSTLPNERNNPEQEELYRAFLNDDVEAVRKVDRKDRKQIFMTGMSARYVDDVELALLDKAVFVAGGSRRVDRGDEEDYSEYEEYLEEVSASQAQMGSSNRYILPAHLLKKGQQATKVENKAGFVVRIEGYSPYENIGELLDPSGAGSDQSRWGVVTRLLHLDEFVDGNSPFKLFRSTETEHFTREWGEVDLNADMPSGIGLVAQRNEGTKTKEPSVVNVDARVLIDPMTKEVISKVPKLNSEGKRRTDRFGNDVYEINDHWFVICAKFVWKDAPKSAAGAGTMSGLGGKMAGMGYGNPRE
jgi:type IV pilus assembly protein PilM